MNDGNHHGFALPDELIMLRDQVRRFMREEVKPIENGLPHDATGCAPEDRARLRATAEAMGMTRLTVPEEYGGNQVSALARAIVAEESAKCRLGAYAPALGAFAGGPPVVIWGGTPEQIEKYGMPCVDGKKRAFVAITEPTGGSDPRNNIETRAVFEGGKWRFDGPQDVDHRGQGRGLRDHLRPYPGRHGGCAAGDHGIHRGADLSGD